MKLIFLVAAVFLASRVQAQDPVRIEPIEVSVIAPESQGQSKVKQWARAGTVLEAVSGLKPEASMIQIHPVGTIALAAVRLGAMEHPELQPDERWLSLSSAISFAVAAKNALALAAAPTPVGMIVAGATALQLWSHLQDEGASGGAPQAQPVPVAPIVVVEAIPVEPLKKAAGEGVVFFVSR